MAEISIKGRKEPIQASPAFSLLNNLLQNEVPISHLCGGKAGCGTCRVRIIEGMENCSPMLEREQQRLKKQDGTLPREVRLACQTYVRGCVRIEILLPGQGKRES